mgnify:CR=1 FL=1
MLSLVVFLYILIYITKWNRMVTKILFFVLIMCILNLIKEGFRFGICFSKNEKYESDIKRTLFTWASISYILTIIFCGL